MVKLGRKIVKFRIPIFILSLLLLIPAGIGYINTRVNYDVLYYLPDDIETMKGQDILVDEFGTGAYSMFVCEGMPNKDVAALKKKMEKVDHVAKVVWYDSFADLSPAGGNAAGKYKEGFVCRRFHHDVYYFRHHYFGR